MSKKNVNASAADKLTPDQVLEVTTAFKEFDNNGNGFITSDEMKECLRRSNVNHDDDEVDEVMTSMDSNRDGTVSFDEYLKFMSKMFTAQSDHTQQGSSTHTKKK
jgi:calmodulin